MKPLYLDRHYPELVPARAPGKSPGRRPPSDDTTLLPTSIWTTYTFDQGNPSSYALNQSVSFKKGQQWSVWKDAVLSRGANPADIVETATTVAFNGDAVIELLSLPSRATMAHSPPIEHVNDMRSRSKVGTKFGFALFNFESLNMGADWNPATEPLRAGRFGLAPTGAILLPDPTSGCISNGTNGYIRQWIDKFEARDRSGPECSGIWDQELIGTPPENAIIFTKHTWDLDLSASFTHPLPPGGVELYRVIMADLFAKYLFDNGYTTRIDPQSADDVLIDWFIWDNVLSNPFKGSASNDFDSGHTSAAYVAEWKLFLALLRVLFPTTKFPQMIWGNSAPLATSYLESDLQGRFVEFWQRDGGGNMRTLATLKTDLDDILASGAHANLSLFDAGFGDPNVLLWLTAGGPGVISSTNYGTWAEIRAYAATIGCTDQLVVDCGRATSGGYLFWDSSFIDPRDGV